MSDLLTKLRSFESFLTKNVETQGIVGQAADTIESLTSENTRLRALLEEKEKTLGTALGHIEFSVHMGDAGGIDDAVRVLRTSLGLAIKEKIE